MVSRLASISSALFLTGLVGVIASACGTSGDSIFTDADGGDTDPGGQHNQDGSFNFDANNATDPDAFFAKDPPPAWCGPAGTANPTPVPGGTPDCPDDKNRDGCPCPEVGKQAACWPGLRANRNMGVCKDGVTTCKQSGELGQFWGPCVGSVLPTPGVTVGKAACRCFSEGKWKIENLVPYFLTYSSNGHVYAMSTSQDAQGKAVNPYPPFPTSEPPAAPTAHWSKDSLSVDCAGHFNLCYELRSGDFNNPKASDCSIGKVCTGDFDYLKENVEQALPDLLAWMTPATGTPTAEQTACANAFHQHGGYGEMSVLGKSVLCDEIGDGKGGSFVFNRIQYCDDSGKGPDGGVCGQDGSGVFH